MNHALTPLQEDNMRKLATYLLAGEIPMEFNMSVFCDSGISQLDPADAECGTVGCALGHGPAAGIAPHEHDNWHDYGAREFGANEYDVGGIWDWCFGALWVIGDNTAAGAGRRILWLLSHGVPDDGYAQMNGTAPLCYV